MVCALPHTCLTRFLPATCPEHVAVQIDPDGCLRKGQDSSKENNKRLDFSAWLMAWKRYAMGEHFIIFAWWCLLLVICLPAAAVLKQLSFKQAMAHEEIVAEVACQAQHSGGRARSLGVIYDEVARTGSACPDAMNMVSAQ